MAAATDDSGGLRVELESTPAGNPPNAQSKCFSFKREFTRSLRVEGSKEIDEVYCENCDDNLNEENFGKQPSRNCLSILGVSPRVISLNVTT